MANTRQMSKDILNTWAEAMVKIHTASIEDTEAILTTEEARAVALITIVLLKEIKLAGTTEIVGMLVIDAKKQ